MSENLLGSENPLCFIDNNNNAIVSVFRIIGKEFSNLQPNQRVIDLFKYFVESGKVPTLLTLIAYVVGK